MYIVHEEDFNFILFNHFQSKCPLGTDPWWPLYMNGLFLFWCSEEVNNLLNIYKCRVIEKYRFYRFCRQKMWKSDKNNINIGPDVRLKKMRCFLFFRKFVPVPHNGFHIIMKNHSEFRLFFPMSDETQELLYHNKQAWLHHGRLNFTQLLSQVWRGRATMMLRTKWWKVRSQ